MKKPKTLVSPTDLLPRNEKGELIDSHMDQSMFSALRAFLAEMEPTKTLNQDAMAALIGCKTSNTYSKWERGDQPPPSTVCRAMEFLLYYTLVKRGEFVSEADAFEKLIDFKIRYDMLGPNTALSTRATDVPRRVASEHMAAYDCFCMMSGAGSENTITTDGYLPTLTGKHIKIIPGFNRNGKLAGNTLEMISIVAGMVSQDWYPEYAKYILTGSDNQAALDAILPPTYRNDGTGIPTDVAQTYKERGVHYELSINTEFFSVRRENLTMIVTMSDELALRFNLFMAVASKIAQDAESASIATDELQKELAGIVAKMPEAKYENGVHVLPSNVFTIKHCIGSNLRPKTRDINVIEKALCHINGVDPATIKAPAAMLVRNAYGNLPEHSINVLDDVHWSLFNEWTAKATDGKKSDKPLIRLPIQTHFFTAIIVDRMLVIHLNEQVAGPALEGLNAFIRSSGILEVDDTPKRSVSNEVSLIRGRANKIARGMVVSKSGAAKITGLPTRIRANDPIKTAIADAMALARPIPKAELELWDDAPAESKTIEIVDILSKRNTVRSHLINAIERLLLGLDDKGVDINYLTHTSGCGPIIKRLTSEIVSSHTYRVAAYVKRAELLKSRARARRWKKDLLANLLSQLRNRLGLDADMNNVLTAVCKFFVFRLEGSTGVLIFKRQSYIDAINNALAKDTQPIQQSSDDDDEDDSE